jgi:hypothetical protein
MGPPHITASDRDKYSGLLPEIYINRGRVYRVVGNLNLADQDFRSAVRISSKPSLYAEAAVSFFLNVEDFDSARQFVYLLDATSDEAAFMIAVTEYQHAQENEKRERILALQSLADREINRATEARFFCVQWAIGLKDYVLARQSIPGSFVERQPFQGNTLLGWIDLEAGNKEKARGFADLALNSSSRSANNQEIGVLARLLVSLDEHEKALPLLEQIATPGVLDDECKRLVECAQRLNRHDTLLRVCDELRQTNQQDNKIRRLEVELLSHYAPEKAFVLTKQFVQYDKSFFSVARNYLAVRLGNLDEIKFDEENLPSPDDFEPEDAYLVITPYIEVKRYRDALEYAYQQLRKHFSKSRAHGQYIWFVVQYGKELNIPNPLDVVDEQSAIRLENLTTGEQRWVVIEDRQPEPARNEYSCSTSVAQNLIGKRKGDIVDLCGPSLQPQQERIVEVQAKYIRLFQDVMSNFQRRFPDVGAIQSIHLVTEGHFDPSPLIEGLKARRQHVEEATAFYHNNPCSLHALAKGLGINERQLMIGLAAHEDWFVRCVECSPRQYSDAANAGFDTNKVVLDISAIITISQLDAWDQLDRQWEFLVSRATSVQITEWQHLAEKGSQPTAYSYLGDDGKMVFRELSPEEMQNECDEIKKIVDGVNSLSRVKDSIALAKIDPKRREQYIQICGLSTLESMSIARDEKAMFWTDDLFVGVVAEVDFGVKRIWTQLAFKILDNAKRINSATYSKITAKLTAWSYITTIWNPQDAITAGGLCDWDTSQWPLKQCIRLIGICAMLPEERAGFALEVFRLLRHSTCVELRRSAVIQAILDAIGDKHVVAWMRQNLDRIFRFDPSTAKYLNPELAYWLRLR